MSETNKWAESLGISESQVLEWCQDNKPDQPVPFHLMLTKRIDDETYLNWARQEFGLASLGRSYFLERPDAELWYAMKIEHHWSPWFLPLKIWDNTLFVGCVQPPPVPLNISLPVHYVLCPAAGLERLWKFYMDEMGVDVALKTNFTTSSPKIPSVAPEEQRTATSAETLGGLNFGDLTASSGKLTPRQKTHETAPATAVKPAGDFSFDFSNLALNKPDGEVKTKPIAETTSTPQVPPSPPTPTFSGTVARFELARPEISKPAPAPAPATPPPPPVRPSAPPTVPPISSLKIPSVKPASGTTSTTVTPIGAMTGNTNGAINLASFQLPPSMEMAKSFEQIIAYTFKEMSAHYEKCLFAAYDGPRLIVAHWTSNVTVDMNTAGKPLVTDKPNMFKIAHDTKKPFHGPVSLNETNNHFFTVWNASQVPVVMTIYPVVNGSTLLGHLIGMSSKELDVYASLEAMGAIATQLCIKTQNLAA